ncbi:MAG: helix-hairpin-helix domain-containing protein [Syntrophobacterales bacterium]|nr:helix-hairpin-helix domain-containing protein [Syntrophobacterales bacterium]
MKKWLNLIVAVLFMIGTVGFSSAAEPQPQQKAPAAQQPAPKEQAPVKPTTPEAKPATAPAPKEVKEEKAPAKSTKKAEAAKTMAPININTANEAELQKLPGIGKVLSKRIVEYRTQHGPFAAPEDLMKVKGITQKKFDAIKNHIVVK